MKRPILLLIPLLIGGGCGRTSNPIDSDVREYIRLAVALGERDPDSIDFYYGPPEWVADIRKNPPALSEIKRSALALIKRMRERYPPPAVESPRERRLRRQLETIAARVDLLLGKHLTFDEETQIFFDLTIPDSASLAPAREKIGRLLPGNGSLADRYSAFDGKFMIPPDRVAAVMARAVQGCRDQTRAHLTLPAGEQLTVEYVYNQPWSAFSRYQGNFRSKIQINLDFGLTVDRALQLACHEGYPGHHAFNVLRDVQLSRIRHETEWTVQPTFSPPSLLSEAAATYATQLAFPGEERVRFERDALFPLAGLPAANAGRYFEVERLVDSLHPEVPLIARDYLDRRLEFARATGALEDRALMAHSDATLKYLNEYRTYVVTYTSGLDLFTKLVEPQAPEAGQARWRAFERIITNPDFSLARPHDK